MQGREALIPCPKGGIRNKIKVGGGGGGKKLYQVGKDYAPPAAMNILYMHEKNKYVLRKKK